MSYRNLSNILTPTGVTPGTYGSNTSTVTATVDASGRVAEMRAQPISLPSASITDATSGVSANTIVRRDANGSFSANTVTATLAGRADRAVRLDKPLKLELIGDVAGSFTTDGSVDQTAMVYLASSGVTAGNYGSADAVATFTVDAKGRLTAAASTVIRIASAAISDATPNTTSNSVVRRNTNGGFSAGPSNFGGISTVLLDVGPNGNLSGGINLVRGTSNSVLNGATVRFDHDGNFLRWYENASPFRGAILDLSKCASQSILLHTGIFDPTSSTAAFAGTAATASRLATARTIGVTGDVSGSTSFDGTANATVTATIRDNLTVGGTSHLGFPSGTTAQRPTGAAGMIRYNSTLASYEVFMPATSRWHMIDTLQARTFSANQFDNPNNATDWPYPALAPAQGDTVSFSLTVRAFDDTAVEGVGMTMHIPSSATTMTVRWLTRCATAPTSAANNGAAFALVYRQFPNNGAVPAWTTAFNVTQTFALTNQWQYASAVVTFGAGSMTPGLFTQLEFARLGNAAADTVVGDVLLAEIVFEYA